MVGSYNKAQKADGHHGPNHSHVAERLFFAGVIGYDVGNHAEAWENQNIDFGVAEESEQVLIKNGVTSSSRVKEGGVKVSVCEEHCNTGGKNGQREKE